MKRRFFVALLAFTVAPMFSGCASCGHPANCEKYKVATEFADPVRVEKRINEFTQQGWRLVSVSAGGGDATHVPMAILVFKKNK